MDLTRMREAKDLSPLEEALVERLTTVIDPELGIDLVNLGLIYRADLSQEGVLKVLMTLTTPMCPLADVLIEDLNLPFEDLEEVKEVEVTLTFDPPWTLDKLSRYAKIALGIF